MAEEPRKLIYLDQVFTERGATADVSEQLEDLQDFAAEGLTLVEDVRAHRAKLQVIVADAKAAVKDLEVDLLILEALETGRFKHVRRDDGAETLEIDEDLAVERLSE